MGSLAHRPQTVGRGWDYLNVVLGVGLQVGQPMSLSFSLESRDSLSPQSVPMPS